MCSFAAQMSVPSAVLRAGSPPHAELSLKGESARAAGDAAFALPVDSGFTVEAEVAQRFVKGEDIAFCFRADPGLLGRAMASDQPDDPAEWKLNYDLFVVCDGHSGVAVRSGRFRAFRGVLRTLGARLRTVCGALPSSACLNVKHCVLAASLAHCRMRCRVTTPDVQVYAVCVSRANVSKRAYEIASCLLRPHAPFAGWCSACRPPAPF